MERRKKNRLPKIENTIQPPIRLTTEENGEYPAPPETWLGGSILFAKAIIFILEDNEGIIIALNTPEMQAGFPNIENVVVFKRDNMVYVTPVDLTDGLKEGDFVTMTETEEEIEDDEDDDE